MDTHWIQTAEAILTDYQWGSNGKFLGISRMFKEEDLYSLEKGTFVASLRPRGVLSGFLVIAPNADYAVYIPPLSAKIGPKRIRMRIKPFEKVSIVSVYWSDTKRLILEDVLVWDGEPVWFSKSFEIRWNTLMNEFVETRFKADSVYQGATIECAKYQSLDTLDTPPPNTVVEFTPMDSKRKRWIWITGARGKREEPTAKVEKAEKAEKVEKVENAKKTENVVQEWLAKKEPGSGPDVFTLFRSGVNQGYSLVRTLAISRALRNSSLEDIPVKVEWNPTFGKWEIVGLH